jgi:hypothetical protein
MSSFEKPGAIPEMNDDRSGHLYSSYYRKIAKYSPKEALSIEIIEIS